MEILLHKKLGGFTIPQDIYDDYEDLHDYENNDVYHKLRIDLTLIEHYKNNNESWKREMVLVSIPYGYHYHIKDYDGHETLLFSKTEIKEL
jgi:hypothetical protein